MIISIFSGAKPIKVMNNNATSSAEHIVEYSIFHCQTSLTLWFKNVLFKCESIMCNNNMDIVC